jgi:hypothetical protein
LTGKVYQHVTAILRVTPDNPAMNRQVYASIILQTTFFPARFQPFQRLNHLNGQFAAFGTRKAQIIDAVACPILRYEIGTYYPGITCRGFRVSAGESCTRCNGIFNAFRRRRRRDDGLRAVVRGALPPDGLRAVSPHTNSLREERIETANGTATGIRAHAAVPLGAFALPHTADGL